MKYILNIERRLKYIERRLKYIATLLKRCGCFLSKEKVKNITPNAPKSIREDIMEWFISIIWGVLQYDSPEGIKRVTQYYSQKVILHETLQLCMHMPKIAIKIYSE